MKAKSSKKEIKGIIFLDLKKTIHEISWKIYFPTKKPQIILSIVQTKLKDGIKYKNSVELESIKNSFLSEKVKSFITKIIIRDKAVQVIMDGIKKPTLIWWGSKS